MKASDIFVKALENEGVEYIFGIPGEENLDMLESIRKSSIKFILTRHEQGAGFMAATYGRLTGKTGVCLSTLGPGATNLITPIAYAYLGGMPILVITGQKPIRQSKQGQFQIVNIVNMMRPITKFTQQIVEGSRMAPLVRDAFRLAESERPGPVHLEIPEDIARQEVPEDESFMFPVNESQSPYASQAMIEKIAQLILGAKHPLLLIGDGGNRQPAPKALRDFVDQTGIPFLVTQMGNGVIDERLEGYLGTTALSDHDFLHTVLKKADVIVNVGFNTVEKPPFIMEHGKYKGRKIIHINYSEATIDKIYFPYISLIGDISHSMQELAKKIENGTHNWNFDEYYAAKAKAAAHSEVYDNDTRFPMLPQHLVKVMRSIVPDDGIVSLDNGIYKIWFARNYKTYFHHTMLLDNALASMGAGLPAAIVAKLIKPRQKVIAVCGDGGFMMNSQELETAYRLGIDITVVILNDNAFGMIKWKQSGMGFENYGLDYGNPDLVKYVESYGGRGFRPNSSAEFATMLTEAIDYKGISLIDVSVDYSLNHEVLNIDLQKLNH
ncbi:acetolactate synthase large subunit [Candidatus Haliotispira prima]|uniref:Acetolactate synthase large subunit n=1 Tax=Candidatus Haliotispira prima TaxID=3034016 RepID=A0ABY8MEJ2_9SPIO|nr:acetolactate synthase large subunit [Candidatus Haliotispira prima]